MRVPCTTVTHAALQDVIKRISYVNMQMTHEVTHAPCAQEHLAVNLLPPGISTLTRPFVYVLVKDTVSATEVILRQINAEGYKRSPYNAFVE
jgi:hypothetical protein